MAGRGAGGWRVKVTVLGCAGSHIGAQRMCSSYLVEAEGYRLLLDCGNGSLSNLQQRLELAQIDAVLLSHLHVDHFADLYSLYYALRFHRDGPRTVDVHAPRGSHDFVAQLLGDDDQFGRTCRFSDAAAGDRLSLGPFDVTLFAGVHPVESLASRITAGGHVLAYSGDSAPTPNLVDCARDADAFLCDSTWLERQRPLPPDIHCTGAEAGRIAAQAGAARLMVTHVFPATDPAEVAAEAADVYDGEILTAVDLMELAL